VVGDVLDEAFNLYKAHWKHLMGVALAFYLVASTLTLVLTLLFGEFGAAAGAFVLLVGIFWLTGALVEAVADVRDGRADLTLGQTFERVGPRVLSLLGASILAGIGIAIGLVLLLVPGLILLTWWCLIPAAVVLERRGVFESFGRSRGLVRGHGWSVFGVLVVTYLLTSIISAVIRTVLTSLPDYIGHYLASLVAGTVVAPFTAVAVTTLYFKLRGPETSAETLLQPEAR
jgi:hypothetical protein